jgi:hypothetical protein
MQGLLTLAFTAGVLSCRSELGLCSFIRKVYAILTCQLLVTFGITFAFVFHEGLRTFVQTHPGEPPSEHDGRAFSCCKSFSKPLTQPPRALRLTLRL